MVTKRLFGTIGRRPDLVAVTRTHIEAIRGLCPVSSSEEADLTAVNTDWMGKYHGNSPLVVYPSNSQEISSVLNYCNRNRLGVVPQGGNTGLVGGATPVYDEIVVNLKRLNRIVEVDEDQRVLVCEAGCILESLNQKLGEVGLMMPLDLGAKGSCHIGGNVATNAGGIRLLRFGSMHANVLGLEWVQSDGTIVNNLSKLRKDNTGYDLKQLMIGSEGSLGIITQVALLVQPKPTTVNLAYLALDSFEKVIETMNSATRHLGEIVSAIEFQDRQSLDFVLAHSNAADPIEKKHAFYMVIETLGFCPENDSERMMNFVDHALHSGSISDGIIAQDASQIHSLWSYRESVSESASKAGRVFKYDVSIPVKEMYRMVEILRGRLAGILPPEMICGYGHVGDSNLHVNIVCPDYCPQIQNLLEPFVYEAVQQFHGSISAEHGMGLMKAQHIGYSRSSSQIAIMQSLKNLFDPNGILNPYKVFPSRAASASLLSPNTP